MDSASTGDLPFRATPTSIASRYSGELDPRAAFFTTGDAEKAGLLLGRSRRPSA
jgi:hypothetical protein